MSDSLEQALTRLGLQTFRPGQREVIQAVLSGRPTVAIMPTGAGKSLCYQLPSLLCEGLTLVVSPLIALMKDQVDALRARGVGALSITSAESAGEREAHMRELASGAARLVYVAPERFKNPRFLEALEGVRVALLAIDEAHCISHWGHDFRPDYLRIGEMRERLKPERTVALTATATPEVRAEIVERLGLERPLVFVRGFDRPNLRFVVERAGGAADKIERAAKLVRERGGGTAIVYAATRKNAEAAAQGLTAAGLRAQAYHAGLDDGRRTDVQDAFARGALDAIVATNAFGMGVDKADVRLVVHHDMPRSLEAFYQEAGRAGRDGAAADAVLLFNPGDARLQEFLIDGSYPSADLLRRVWKALQHRPAPAPSLPDENDMQVSSAVRILEREGLLVRDSDGVLHAMSVAPEHGFDPRSLAARAEIERKKLRLMQAFCYSNACRRKQILAYFGDEEAEGLACGNCDACDRRASARPLTEDERWRVRAALSALKSAGGRFGRMKIAQALCGSEGEEMERTRLVRMAEYGVLKQMGREQVLDLLDAIVAAGLAEPVGREYPTLEISERGRQALAGAIALEELGVVLTPATPATPARKARRAAAPSPGPQDQCAGGQALPLPPATALVARLRELRLTLARRDKVPPYVIFPDTTLAALAASRPQSDEALRTIPGIGPARAEKYGAALLEALRS